MVLICSVEVRIVSVPIFPLLKPLTLSDDRRIGIEWTHDNLTNMGKRFSGMLCISGRESRAWLLRICGMRCGHCSNYNVR